MQDAIFCQEGKPPAGEEQMTTHQSRKATSQTSLVLETYRSPCSLYHEYIDWIFLSFGSSVKNAIRLAGNKGMKETLFQHMKQSELDPNPLGDTLACVYYLQQDSEP